MATKIGVIAEDNSDVDVIKEILSKYLKKEAFSITHFVGKGCGKLKSKCAAWVDQLEKKGCKHIFLFHDLDRNKEENLKRELTKKLENCSFPSTLIIIPREELEAWLLADTEAIRRVFAIQKKIKPFADIEQVKSPKEHLERLVRQQSEKKYLNTIHNKKIASEIDVSLLENYPSYQPFHNYVTTRI
ncbi:TPA: DUF4276 family protein [Pseudomonas aeruginosa]|jgi:hypothetical protein|nr:MULTISPECIES: DUF4276 family protein [Pseudomonas]EIW4150306.1 DUF4276 family protein [Pseudomonas aeruginosa]EKU5855148.1 DUF4276 family protein [Pseudomonas aeruginosa]EKU5858257.1 DUF4276 family protein [Pseudomonas aeruginosa]EKW2600938.1 DUF4276 family protein [Pseudomonas aeruginosa]EKW2601654.1 DUF4276 family protein [Pseudomonas aeruginosa]